MVMEDGTARALLSIAEAEPLEILPAAYFKALRRIEDRLAAESHALLTLEAPLHALRELVVPSTPQTMPYTAAAERLARRAVMRAYGVPFAARPLHLAVRPPYSVPRSFSGQQKDLEGLLAVHEAFGRAQDTTCTFFYTNPMS